MNTTDLAIHPVISLFVSLEMNNFQLNQEITFHLASEGNFFYGSSKMFTEIDIFYARVFSKLYFSYLSTMFFFQGMKY